MQSPSAFVRGVRHPEAYHGAGIRREFFEGWYVKLVSADTKQRWAVIPGIFRGLGTGTASGDEAFVQVLDGLTGRSWYHRFEISEFRASTSGFDVWIGPNHFTSTGVHLELPQLQGDIEYSTALKPWPVTLASPGIMGWYGLVPFMECFHGVVSFGHELSGQLEVEGEIIDFASGRGYIEKDWGKAFPSGYVWLHSNHLDQDADASLIASVAIIPWIGRPFRGFVIGLMHHGRLHRWTTYNGSKEVSLTIDDSHVNWSVNGPDGLLSLRAKRVRGGLLHAPLRVAMHKRVEETLDATIEFRHSSPTGEVLLEGLARVSGMEVFGDTEGLLAI